VNIKDRRYRKTNKYRIRKNKTFKTKTQSKLNRKKFRKNITKKIIKGGDITFTNFNLLNNYWKRHPILSKNSFWYLITENNMSLQLGTNIQTYENLKNLIQQYLTNRGLDTAELPNGIRIGIQIIRPKNYSSDDEDDGNFT